MGCVGVAAAGQGHLATSAQIRPEGSPDNLKRRSVVIPESKNGHSRTIPLKAIELLKGLNEMPGRVSPIAANALRLSWVRLTERASIENLHFHDLRHEAISRLFEMGLTVPEVASISGHKDIRMLMRYAHPNQKRVHDIFASLHA